jgi:hypothetical protein
LDFPTCFLQVNLFQTNSQATAGAKQLNIPLVRFRLRSKYRTRATAILARFLPVASGEVGAMRGKGASGREPLKNLARRLDPSQARLCCSSSAATEEIQPVKQKVRTQMICIPSFEED